LSKFELEVLSGDKEGKCATKVMQKKPGLLFLSILKVLGASRIFTWQI
jgi:hypothetical protein